MTTAKHTIQPTPRQYRGAQIAAAGLARPLAGLRYTVASQSQPGRVYIVSLEGQGSCQCEDYQRRGGQACKHVLAARAIDRAFTAIGAARANGEEDRIVGECITRELQFDAGLITEFSYLSAQIFRVALSMATATVEVAA